MREPNSHEVMLAGDWHGNGNQSYRVIQSAEKRGLDTIFQLGDFGIWRGDERYLDTMQNDLESRGMHLFFIDGNHEDFDRLYSYPLNEEGLRPIRPNITHVPRGYTWEWYGIRFMGLGGAASIDKSFRKEGRDWWPQELLTDDDVHYAQLKGRVDVMFTHDSPASAPNSITDDPVGQGSAGEYYGDDNLEICTEHRKKLQEVTDVTRPRYLYHGHYHQFMTYGYQHPGDEHDSYVVGLDEGGAMLGKHAIVLDFEVIIRELMFGAQG